MLVLVFLFPGCNASSHNQHPGACVFDPQPDSDALDAYIYKDSPLAKLNLTDWDLSILDTKAELTLHGQGFLLGLSLKLDENCKISGRARILEGQSADFTRLDWPSIADRFPLQVEGISQAVTPAIQSGAIAALWNRQPLSKDSLFLMVLAFIVVFFLLSRSEAEQKHLKAFDLLLAFLLVLLAAAPIYFLQFDTRAEILRVAYSAACPTCDWNHPFPAYWINGFFSEFSYKPAIMRLGSLLFLLAETLLLLFVATRRGGRLAGVLAVLFFVCEIRRRHGLFDISDWDLAGFFLLTWLYILQLADENRLTEKPLALLSLALVFFAGGKSSYMMLPVAAAFLLTFIIKDIRTRSFSATSALLAGIFVFLAWQSVEVFIGGQRIAGHFAGGFLQLLWNMLSETPSGRSWFMLLPLLAGLWLMIKNARSHYAGLFSLLSLMAVLAAMILTWSRSSLSGTYYFGILTPLLVFWAALTAAKALSSLNTLVRGSSGKRKLAVRLTLAVTLSVLFISFPVKSISSDTPGLEFVRLFDLSNRDQDTKIVYNWQAVGSHMHYNRLLFENDYDPRRIIFEKWPQEYRKLRMISDNRAFISQVKSDKIFSAAMLLSKSELQDLTERLPERCRIIYPVTTKIQQNRALVFFHCDK